ncbi:hypothetical protein, partial [Algoriphagus sp. PAP.12]|uniref:hypothetical protein n=1 Tax=Algoriphagus sp. PAP.12 TaxID=2996678 RepID=UPI00227A0DDE
MQILTYLKHIVFFPLFLFLFEKGTGNIFLNNSVNSNSSVNSFSKLEKFDKTTDRIFACNISLTSAVGSDNQTICDGTPISTISFTVDSGTISVSGTLNGLTVTGDGTSSLSITGIPTADVSFNIIASGGTCDGTGIENVSGSITVNPAAPTALSYSDNGPLTYCA